MRQRAIQAIVICLVVVLAGCTGLGGLGGSGDDGTATASNAGSDGDASTERAASGSGNATVADSGSSGSSDGGSSGGAETAAGSGSSSAGSSDPSGSDAESSNSGSLAAGDEWFNLSKPGRYVFEIESAEEGTGRMSFEVTNVENGEATVKTGYELGGESAESSVTGPVGEVQPQLAMSPIYGYLVAIQLGGIGAGAFSGGEDLEVGNEFSQQSAEGSMHIEVTGTDSYAGVDCYVIETRINGTLTQEVCTQQAFSSAPYVAIYDENGTLTQRVELVEYERN